MRRVTFIVLMTAAFAALSYSAVLPAIQTIPSSGNVSGLPGTVVGWGFTLTFSGTPDWVVLNDSFFTGSTVFGNYVDYLVLPAAPLYVAGPSPESATVHQDWDLASNPRLGLGEFDINGTAMPLASITGNIHVDYTVFSQDPNDPNFDPDSFVSAGFLLSPVDVVVAQATPEPASILLLSAAVLPFALAVRRRRRARG